ncbi:MAG: SIS domain-containing protein [Ignavibacteria bacterium]|nr:SIS domain-containing protein [Ignavibacteria bacterium]
MEINEYFEIFKKVLDKVDPVQVMNMINEILRVYKNDNQIFIIGNGGSAAKASHLAQDLSKGTIPDINKEKRIRALSLTDNVPFITAVANDENYENIFYIQLKTFAKRGDCLISISGSGNSPNVIKAAEYAISKGIKTIGITGFDGGKLKKLCDISVHVPLNEMAMVESVHSVILHYTINYLRMVIEGTKFDNDNFNLIQN